jgi:3-hydroxyisobutyrate dehydrogenase-like beta-hydroxyacid dehydrogenase
MGAGMAARLLAQGFPMSVWNRSPHKAQPLVSAGAELAASPAAAVEKADVVMLSLADEQAVESVLFGPEGAAGALRPDTAIVNTSTLSPRYARQLASRLYEYGARHIEACVLGNPAQARDGELRVVAAGEPGDVEHVWPVLSAVGKQVVRVGPAGYAATTKLVFNAFLGAQVAALAEVVGYGVAAGLDRAALLTAIADSGFASPALAFRARLMLAGRYEPPAFRSALMDKDLRLALDDGAEHGATLPVVAAAEAHFAEVVAVGNGDRDAAVVIELLAGRERQ